RAWSRWWAPRTRPSGWRAWRPVSGNDGSSRSGARPGAPGRPGAVATRRPLQPRLEGGAHRPGCPGPVPGTRPCRLSADREERNMAAEIALPPTDDVVDVLSRQHDRARALLAELHETVAAVADITGDMAEPFRELVQLLVGHETAEELVVYPALRSELEEGRLVEARMAEEHEAKQLLARVEKMAAGFFAFPAALGELEARVLAHAEQEEQTVLPLLE